MKTGDKIRVLRSLKGLSQENMADMVGLSRLAYGDIERGKVEPNPERLKQIAEKLGLNVEDIDAFGNTVSNFFDQCNGANINAGVNNQPTQTNNNFDQRELQHQIEKLELEVKLLKNEKEKAELEAKYWKEKSVKQ